MILVTQLNYFYSLIDKCDRLAMNSGIKQVEASNIVFVYGTKQSTQKRPHSTKRAKNYTMLSLYSLSLSVIGHPPAALKNRNREIITW